jgi:hypothetical protein
MRARTTGSTVVFEEGIKAQVGAALRGGDAVHRVAEVEPEEVCAAYDVPPPVVHILDHATFSNITEQLRSSIGTRWRRGS